MVQFPDHSDEEQIGLVDKDESTENNTDIEREERNFVNEQRNLIHS